MTELEICEAYNNGESITSLANLAHHCKRTIKHIIERNGINLRNQKEARRIRQRNIERSMPIDDICNDYSDGICISTLSHKYNTSFKVIKRILSTNNINVNNKPKKKIPINIIDEYNSGIGMKKLGKMHGISEGTVKRFLLRNGVRIRNRSEASIISAKRTPRKLSDETKKKISLARKKFLKENPDKVPYLLNHSSKETYPEQRFKEILNNIGLVGWIQHYQHSIYQYDFAFPEVKLDVEIDGSTHTLPSVIAKDIERDKFSRDKGWEVLRFTASELNKDAEKCINKLLSVIYKLDSEYDPYDTGAWSKIKDKLNKSHLYDLHCPICDTDFSHRDKNTVHCSRMCYIQSLSNRTNKPPREQLISDIEQIGYFQTGKKYGVSYNTIRKWIRAYGVSFQRKFTDEQITEIHNKRATGMSFQKIADEYNVARSTIFYIINKQTYN